jgi:methyl-accepting chemotaxis protein
MDAVTQQNAALVEESAAAAESMQHQANALAEVVKVFNTGTQRAAAAAVQAAPRKPAARNLAPAVKPAAASRKPVMATAAGDDWEEF